MSGGGQRLRRPLQKGAKIQLYPFAMPLTGIPGCLSREFCNSLERAGRQLKRAYMSEIGIRLRPPENQ